MAKLIEKAIDGELSNKNANEIINSIAFSDSYIYFLDNIKSEQWQLITKDFNTNIKTYPKMPITNLQKSFLKAISLDKRFRLFCDDIIGLEDVEPLYFERDFYYFDKILDGDPYSDEEYIKIFQTVLRAIKEHRRLNIVFRSGKGIITKGIYFPQKLEYSEKDDKFRIICSGGSVINMARIKTCTFGAIVNISDIKPIDRNESTVVISIKNERKALERCMLHFANLKKETRQIDDKFYEMKLTYYKDDETEVLIRILSFGPMLKVISPQSFIDLIKERLNKQKSCELR